MRGRGKKSRESAGSRRSGWKGTQANNQMEEPINENLSENFTPSTQSGMDMEYYNQDPLQQHIECGDEEEMAVEKDDDDDDVEKKKPWEKPGVAGTKIKKKKKTPGAKNIKIRRYVQPKNAVMCLNELRPGLSYTTEQEGGVQQPFCVSVEVDGQKYRGSGSSKQLAKQAAAEAALISFVKPPIAGSVSDGDEDKTPWATLASFAIYKLFNDWREGRVGLQPVLGQALNALKAGDDGGDDGGIADALAAHLGGKGPVGPGGEPGKGAQTEKVPNPAKAVPENAASMHPVMVLHQMRPGLTYNTMQTSKENKPYFSVTTEIDSKTFSGEGPNMKKAKFSLARDAIRELYGIDSTFEIPA